MNIASFHDPVTGTWTHVLADPEHGVAAIIDPVLDYDPVSGCTGLDSVQRALAQADDWKCAVKLVLDTHAHADHLSAADWLRSERGAQIVMGRGIRAVQRNFKRIFNLEDLETDGRQFDRLVAEGDVVELGSLRIHVLETPGHTDDSISYRVGDAAFVGDTLFAPGFGTARCDFPGGDAGMLFDSIQKLYAMPPQTRLFLCHDYPGDGQEPTPMVTVADSMANNKHVNQGTEREAFIQMREARDATLSLPRLIYPAVQVNIRAGAAPPPETNGARYLKIPLDTSIEALLGDQD